MGIGLVKPNVGGQAVIEGVMMRGPKVVATAVRKPDGEIVVQTRDYVAWGERMRLFKLPVLRGFATLFESLFLGISALRFSADMALEVEGRKKKTKTSDLGLDLWMILSFCLGILLFFYLPLFFASLFGVEQSGLLFNLVAGAFRMTIFFLYIWGITLLKDVKRLFQYHGAEHKSIFCYESGTEMSVKTAKHYSRLHPRCGTSFLVAVMGFAILLFALLDTLLALWLGHPPSRLLRFGWHLLFLPLLAGLAYEGIRASSKGIDTAWVRALIAPGLGMQRITTREPDERQIEVALAALQAVIPPEDAK
jgi:uncharacterized protein YqhQ